LDVSAGLKAPSKSAEPKNWGAEGHGWSGQGKSVVVDPAVVLHYR